MNLRVCSPSLHGRMVVVGKKSAFWVSASLRRVCHVPCDHKSGHLFSRTVFLFCCPKTGRYPHSDSPKSGFDTVRDAHSTEGLLSTAASDYRISSPTPSVTALTLPGYKCYPEPLLWVDVPGLYET